MKLLLSTNRGLDHPWWEIWEVMDDVETGHLLHVRKVGQFSALLPLVMPADLVDRFLAMQYEKIKATGQGKEV